MKVAGYRILEQLSETNNSCVFIGHADNSDQKLLFKTSIQGTEHSVADIAICNEFEITQNLGALLKPLSFQKLDTGTVLIRPFIEGITLHDWAKNRKRSLSEKLTLSILLCEKVESIHLKNIIHKEINPYNIIIDPQTGEVNIIDFGLSSKLELKYNYLGNPQKLEGALEYISPEQTGRMNRLVDYRCDLYSLGVTLYELFTDNLPFEKNIPFELVYSHIARTPVHPSKRKPSLPVVIGDIILKLLAKNAEDRYHSASGLKNDLTECSTQWESKADIETFEPGRFDISLRFQIPQKLYGREENYRRLMEGFEKAASGRKMLMMVGGYTGIGKTALIHDIHIPVTNKRAFFIDGKFEQFQRNVPYLAWTQAFNKFIEIILSQDEDKVAEWKNNILSELGDLAGVVTSLLPSLEKIIGKQSDLPGIPVNEMQNRFNYALRVFIRLICKKEHPLIIFIDDFQWADAASLNLLRVILTEPGLGWIYVIAAYRDNEVNESHPFIVCTEELEKEWKKMNMTDISEAYAADNILIERMVLNNLSEDNIISLLSDTLAMEKQDVSPLASLIYQKTHGNSFFVHRFLESLHEEEYIKLTIDGGKPNWKYDYRQILNLNITDNVIDLLSKKIEKLNSRTREILNKASCIGNFFDIHTLSLIGNTSLEDIQEGINEAVMEGIIVPVSHDFRLIRANPDLNKLSGNKFRFSHDRIKQTIYSFISPENKMEIHKQAGQLMLNTLDEVQLNEKIFEVANHINEAGEKMIDPGIICSVNFKAGVKAKASTAYSPAYIYLIKGMESLPGDAWTTSYDFTLSLYNHTAEAAYLSGNHQEMERLLKVILTSAVSVLDKVKAMEIRTNALFMNLKFIESIASGIEALNMLGFKLPAKPGLLDVSFELIKTKIFFRKKTVDKLVQLPEMTDKLQMAIMRILSNLAPPVFFTNPNLFPIILFRMARISAKYGITSSSPYAFSCYGFVLCGITGEVRQGSDFGKLALDLMKKYDFKEYQARTLFTYYFFIDHWKNASSSTLQPLKESYQRSLESGEADFTAFLGNGYSQVALLNAADLNEVGKELKKQFLYATQTKQFTSLTFNQIYDQYIQCLQNKSPVPYLLKGDAYDAGMMYEELIKTKNKSTLFNQSYYQAQLSLFFGQFQTGLEACDIARSNIKSVVSIAVAKQFPFIDLLIRYHIVLQHPGQKKKHWKKIKSDLKNMKKFSQWNQEEFFLKQLLANACIAALEKDKSRALTLFNELLLKSDHVNNSLDKGIALLEFFRFCQANNFAELAQIYQKRTINWFNQWGATAVAGYLASSNKKNIITPADQDLSASAVTGFSSTSNGISGEIDFYSLLKGSQVISRELNLQQLISRMLEIMVQNAGAERGVIILEKKGKYFAEAEYLVDGTIKYLPSLPFDKYEKASLSVLNYVLNSHQNVVLDNAASEGRFVNDVYISENKVKSLLCFTIQHMENVTGVVYLENNLVPGAFTVNRTEILKILGAQAAISIENAKYYNDIQDLNKSYERFVPKTFLAQLGKQSILDIKLGNQAVKDMSVLFSDIRSFTSISEKISASESFSLLNEIWNVLTPVIDANNGIIDKYIGDAIMALFPVNPEDALFAAIGMQKKLKVFNAEREKNGLFPINIGIGLNAGHLILGTVGTETRLDTTVIGDTVNVTSRLESLTKELHSGVILTEDLYRKLPDAALFHLRYVGKFDLKGKARAARIYEEFSNNPETLLEQKIKYADLFNNAVMQFEEKNYKKSMQLLDEYNLLVPGDTLINYYRQKMEIKNYAASQ